MGDYTVDANNPKRFRYSMRDFDDIVVKKYPNWLTHVLANMSACVHRMNYGISIHSFPQPAGHKSFIKDSFPYGFQSIDDYPLSTIKKEFVYETGKTHYLDDVVRIKGLENIKKAILDNFGKHGPKYPITAAIPYEYFEPLIDPEAAKKAFNDHSFRAELDCIWKRTKLAQAEAVEVEDQGSHAILITGVDVMSEDESEHTVEVKNFWRTKWGLRGYTKVTFEVFADSTIFVPVLDMENRKRILQLCVKMLPSHKMRRIKHICFSADGHHLATAYDNCVRIIQLIDASSEIFKYAKLNIPPGSSLTALCYADLSLVVATATDESKIDESKTDVSKTNVSERDVSLYMVGEDDSLKWHQRKAHPKHIQRLLGAKLNGTTILVTSSEDLNLRVWYGSSGKSYDTETNAKNHVMAISPNGRYIAALASCEKKVKVVELKEGESSTQDLTVSLAFWLDHKDEVVTCLCYTPDSQSIITASRDGNLRVWSLRNPGLVVTPSKVIPYAPQNFTDTKYYHHLSISPDGKLLAVAGASLLRWICVKSGRLIETVWRAHYGNIKGMEWAPAPMRVGDECGLILATMGDDGIEDGVKLWTTPY